ncbi:nickel-dependent lactate racemase [bacterium]
MNIDIQYGDRCCSISIPKSRLAGILKSKSVQPVDPHIILNKALSQPVDAPMLDEFVEQNESLLIIVNDGARHTPTALILETIRPILEKVDIEFLIATGTHRYSTELELMSILGPFYQTHRSRINIHDCHRKSSLEEIGTTSRKTEVWIHRLAAYASKILVIGSVEPHYFAGFTGGRKALIPGVAGFQTVEQNHSHAMSKLSEPMKLTGNPVHEDMEEAVRLLNKNIFSIQVVLDIHDQICAAFTGDLYGSLNIAAETCRKIYGGVISQKADIVVAVATPPLDCDLYQSQKAMEHARLALNTRGILILVSACHEGIGPDHFYQLLTSDSNPDNVLKIIQQGYKLGHHKAANWISLSRDVTLFGVTQLNPRILQSVYMHPFSSVQEALDYALQKKSGRVLVMPSASVTVPVF